MPTQQTSDIPTPAEIWKILDRVGKKIESMAEVHDREIKEIRQMFKETGERFKETDEQFKKTDKKLRETNKLFNGMWGKLVESLVEGDLVKLLTGWGIDVEETSTRVCGKYNGHDYEIDIIAKNGKDIVIVEVKTTLRPDDLKDFMEVLSNIKSFSEGYANKNIFGAVAYIRSESKAHIRAQRLGLFVIRATGNSASIINEKGFRPKSF